MNRAELRARLKDSGLDFLSDDRANQFIDEATAELQAEELWPWRLTTVTGAAPLYINNLGPVEYVRVPSRRIALYPQRKAALLDQFGAIDSHGGPPNYYYVEIPDSVGGRIVPTPTTVTENIEVGHYIKKWWTNGTRTAQSDSDTPNMPAEYHELIELLARERGTRWNYETDVADGLRTYYGMRLEEMRDKEAKTLGGWDEPDLIRSNDNW